MRKIFFTFSLIFIPILLLSQQKLRITYEQRNFNPIPEGLNHDVNFNLAANTYNDRVYDFELFIQENQSLWKRIPHVRDEGTITIDGQWYSFDEPDNRTYLRNLLENTIQYEVYKNQIVEKNISTSDWKIERENQSYFGYEVRRATKQHEYGEIEALFAPELNYSTGPWNAAGLPGLILYYKLTVRDGLSMEFQVKDIEILDNSVDFDIFKNHEVLAFEVYQKKLEEQRQKAREMIDAGVDTSD